MQQILASVEKSLDQQNWYSALIVAMTLPDICGHIAQQRQGRRRFIDWFDRYVAHHYRMKSGEQWLTGKDFYALRCSLTHQGGADISTQEVREAVSHFHFVHRDRTGNQSHCNQAVMGDTVVLQLQVDIVCRQIIEGVHLWMAELNVTPETERRMGDVLKIYPAGMGF